MAHERIRIRIQRRRRTQYKGTHMNGFAEEWYIPDENPGGRVVTMQELHRNNGGQIVVGGVCVCENRKSRWVFKKSSSLEIPRADSIGVD